jgi:hypothetical protein
LSIENELQVFEDDCCLLSGFITDLASLSADDIADTHLFLAEAVTFRLYRDYERLMRAVFLDFCVRAVTKKGTAVSSKLRCDDWDTAEEILKSGNKFLDWGNQQSVRNVANLVFEDGFPVVDFISPVASTLTDLQRFRNFIAHSSREAESGFKKSVPQYIKVGHSEPISVGGLAIYRKSARADITLRIIYKKVAALSQIYKEL